MPTNPLKLAAKNAPSGSAFRALEWAAMARNAGRIPTAELWEKAHDEGWDDANYSPLAAEEFHRKTREAQSGWS